MKENKMEKQLSEEKGCEIRTGIELLTTMIKAKPHEVLLVKDEQSHDHHDGHMISTKPFLSLCNLVLQVLDKIGPTMAVMRQDVHQNIQRLEKLHESDPTLYSNLVEMLKKETTEGIARNCTSCSRAFVWLTRSLDFSVALLQKLAKDNGKKMGQAVEESYNITLKPWHKWISAAAFRVAIKLVPDNETFLTLLMGKDKDENIDTIKEDMKSLVLLLGPFLEDIHSVLRFYGLNRIKAN